VKLSENEFVELLKAGKTIREIATAHNMSARALWRRKKRLASKGFGHGNDVGKFVPDGYRVKGTSTLTDPLGNIKLQWIKTDIDAARQLELMQEAVKALCDDISPIEPTAAPAGQYAQTA